MTEKCSPDDPQRCRSTTKDGQCQYLAVEGSKHCKFHRGETRGGKRAEIAKTERYLIDQIELRDSYRRQQDDKDYLSMKDEIMLLHAVLERRLNSIKTDADVVMAVGHVTQLTQRLESMKINLLKVQQSLGLVLGKDELRTLARKMAIILDEELEGIEGKDELMDRIVKKLCEAIENAGRPEDESI